MESEPETYVFDSGPLSHFALAGWLGMLRHVVGTRTAVIPDTVAAELKGAAQQHSHLQAILSVSWIEERELKTPDEISEFALFSSLLVANGRNRGEAGVLAYAKANSAIAIIDDGPGRKAAQTYHVPCRGTLSLLCDAVRSGHAAASLISSVADDLLESSYRLPFKPGGFIRWAKENDLIPASSTVTSEEDSPKPA